MPVVSTNFLKYPHKQTVDMLVPIHILSRYSSNNYGSTDSPCPSAPFPTNVTQSLWSLERSHRLPRPRFCVCTEIRNSFPISYLLYFPNLFSAWIKREAVSFSGGFCRLFEHLAVSSSYFSLPVLILNPWSLACFSCVLNLCLQTLDNSRV